MSIIKITSNNPHLILQGKSMTGKTFLAEKIARENDMEITWIEAKGIHSPSKGLSFTDSLYDIEKTIEDRLEWLRENKQPNLVLCKDKHKFKTKVIILDDLDFNLMNITYYRPKEIEDKVYSILRMGPIVGIHCIITTQIQPWVLLPKYKDLIFTTINTSYKTDYSYTINRY